MHITAVIGWVNINIPLLPYSPVTFGQCSCTRVHATARFPHKISILYQVLVASWLIKLYFKNMFITKASQSNDFFLPNHKIVITIPKSPKKRPKILTTIRHRQLSLYVQWKSMPWDKYTNNCLQICMIIWDSQWCLELRTNKKWTLVLIAAGGRPTQHSTMTGKCFAIVAVIMVFPITLCDVSLHNLLQQEKQWASQKITWQKRMYMLPRTSLSLLTVRPDNRKNPPPMAHTNNVMNRAYCMLIALRKSSTPSKWGCKPSETYGSRKGNNTTALTLLSSIQYYFTTLILKQEFFLRIPSYIFII